MRHTLFKILALFFVAYTSAQNIDISGIIQDESGIPIPGVNILVKNTTKGSVSDFDGNFTVTNLQVGSTLTFSFIGYITKELVVTNADYLTVTMQEDIAKLDEVVVIGYGSQTKKEVTGAVSIVSSKTIEALKPTRIEQALQGQVAGVNITTQSGSPGGATTISIRGVSTNGDSRPLILVDGNVIEDLSVLNPSDIENINILKDATAGIYGVRAANGVVLITTKTGRKEMPLTIEYNTYGGFQQTTREIPVLNATEYAILVNEAFAAGGSTPPFTDLSILGKGTDWQDKVFQNAPVFNHNIAFKGGGKKSSYSYSASFLTQDGIVGGSKSNFNRFTNNLSYNLDFLDHFKLTSGLTLMRTQKRNLSENALGSVLFNALNMAPTFPVRDENGQYTIAEGLGNEVINPLAQTDDTFNRSKVMRLSGNAGLSYNFLDHFTAQANIQFNYSEVRSKVFSPIVNYGSGKVFNKDRSEVFEGLDYFRDYTFDAFIKYENKINDIHNINVLLGTSVFKTTGEFTGAKGFDIKDNKLINASIAEANDVENINRALGRNPTFDSRLLSYFARAQYDYKGKYLISGVIRRDGSTKFGPANKFGYFPSGSIGWVASDESFLENSAMIDFLKLRASYGVLGNDRIPDFRFVSLLNGEGTYIFNDQLSFGSAAGAVANPEIRWEKQKTLDIGLDMRFLKNKIDVTVDYFKKRTEDLLVIPQVSAILGIGAPGSGPPVVNAGVVENEGFEFAIGYSGAINDNLKFSVKYNLTAIDNEVLSVSSDGGFLPGGSFGVGQDPPSRMEAGFPIGYFRGFKTNGIYQNQAQVDASATINDRVQAGDLIFEDVNNDGIIDEEDKVQIGSPIPEATMGINLSLDYKNFDFSAYAFASVGNEIVRNYERNQDLTNKSIYFLDRWTGQGTSNSSPRVTTGANSNNLFSDFYVEDGSFVRLQNVQLGYTFSKDAFKNSKISKLRLYASASNILTLTKYRGYDPTASSGAPIGGGIDQGFYPNPQTFLLGANLKF
ncbi:MAG: TonB-dependent receptor [Flavobacteriales bacterium]|nr:TonB-dependent receptor [Flavobacteriia bacterium]NCP90039.1 TonB-dependent receptor [Flavobacteriales bacterium]PIV94647.1 MAG: SusC/RagA family protein [Flavobacteriaceae bacterium CG17_big_fil_post_rev_8_21_14_2_50_33_15]PIY13262.1 MAG: SusC/RagA family protein [Flavobacteriaceae bacterium CG_4_10_14_3_um_filter_33_47]PJB16809.1 MAG: SusC/RagA family protein [Flavobacteriaceae bacterium CG_4_9_14_3_um_filter_33_16]